MSYKSVAAPLIVVAVAIIIAVRAESGQIAWTPDGYNYGVHMLVDVGMSKREATATAQRFYSTTTVGLDPRYAHYFKDDVPPYAWTLFSPRVVYPFAASLLYRFRGMYSLIDISAAAYVLAAVVLYWFLLGFGPPLTATLGALGFALWPRITALASTDLTDMTALLFWIVTLAVGCRIVHSGKRGWILAFVPACAVLSFTRPVPYLPFGAGVGVLAAGLLYKNRQATFAGAWMSGIAVACAFAVTIALRAADAPSFTFVLGLAQERYSATAAERQLALSTWYERTLFYIMRAELGHALRAVLPLLAASGALLRKAHPYVPLLAGAAAFALVSILTNPIALDSRRTFEVPLYPLISAGLVLLAGVATERFSRQRLG